MTTYYRDSTVLVSSSAISVDGASYRLDDLGEVWLVKGPWEPQRALAVLVMRLLVDYEICSHFKIFGRIENLTDEEYAEVFGFPNLRRGYYLGASINF